MLTKTLPVKILDAIPVINNDTQIVMIDEKIQEFITLKKTKEDEFYNTRSTPSDSLSSPVDSENDAQQLLQGANLEAFVNPHARDRRRDLLRQIKAVERAISILQNERHKRYGIAVQEACSNLPREVTEVFKNVLTAADNLVEAIRAAVKMEEILDSKSIGPPRDERLMVPAYFKTLIYTSPLNMNGSPALPFYLDIQKKIWEGK